MRQLLIFYCFLLQILTAVRAAGPSTITLTTESDLPAPTECPSDFINSCSLPNPVFTEKFEFSYIRHIQDDLYEVMLEFKSRESLLRPNSLIYSLYRISVDSIIGADGNSHSFTLYSNRGSLVGTSRYHFYLVWVMKMKQEDSMICTNPFTLKYEFETFLSTTVRTIKHGCDQGSEYPIQCWEEICDKPVESTTASEEDTSTTEEESATTEFETGGPLTIVTTKDGMPEPTDCPSEFGPLRCDFEFGQSSKELGYPDLLKFEFKSIKWVEGDTYEVMIEFEIADTIPKEKLRAIFGWDTRTPDNYLPYIQFYAQDNYSPEISESNILGDSPYHFFFKWMMTAKHFEDGIICTTPLRIEYDWYDETWPSNGYYVALYGHYCEESFADVPFQCWTETCDKPEESTTASEVESTTDEESTIEEESTTASEVESTTDEEVTSEEESTTDEESTIEEESTTASEVESTTDEEVTSEEESTTDEESTIEEESTTASEVESTTDEEVTSEEESTTDEESTIEEESTTASEVESTTDEEVTSEEESTTDKESTIEEESTTASEVESTTDEEVTSEEESTTDKEPTTDEEPTTEEGTTTSTEEKSTETVTKEPTQEPTEETGTVAETTQDPPPSVTRTVTVTITDVDPSTTRTFTETVTYTTLDPTPVTRTFTETIIRTDVDPTTTRVITETITYTTIDPSPETRTLTDTLTTVIVDPETPTVSRTLTLTVTFTTPIPPVGGTESDVRITVTRPDTTYVTTVAESSNPTYSFTTIAGAVTTYVPVITNPTGDPKEPPHEEKPGEGPDIFTYTISVQTTIVSDGRTYETWIPVVYTTTVPDDVPDIIEAPTRGPGSTDDTLGTDPDLEELLEDFNDSASGINSNTFILCLYLIFTMIFV